MLTKRNQYDENFKISAVILSYAGPKAIKEIASDLGISESLLYS